MEPRTCERCGHVLPEDARFCPNCGQPVGLSQSQDRKVVTVLFVDLVGSTRLSAELDAERFRMVLGAFYELVGDEISTLGGHPSNFAGDAVVGVFGISQSRDDDALRGVHAGLRIVERTERLASELALSEPLQVRVGVNTGTTAVGENPIDRNVVIGSEVHLAARLQQNAEPGEVLVGETTWLLTRDAVEFGIERKIEAKGFGESVVAWPALRLARGAARRRIAMVNRQRELALLSDTYERVVEHSRSHLVTLLGEPGIGKSRVVDEFLGKLPSSTTVLRGRSSAFEEDATFAPISQMVFDELAIEPSESDEGIRARLTEVVNGLVPDGDGNGEAAGEQSHGQVVDRLGLALGIGEESGEERRYRSGEIRAGFLAFLSGLARRGPVVLVFEDLHLGRETLLETVELLVKEARRIPLLVLGVARWELLDQRPNYAGGLADAVTLWVEPLSVGHATQLALEAGESFTDDEAERVARHAGGNPFFILETSAMLRYEGEDLPPTGGLPARLLPATVQAVVAARIDHLPPEARDVMRKASIFARSSFDLDELGLIASPTAEVLHVLEDEEILVSDPDRPAVWRFRHDLLRDVAYEGVSKRERQRLHLRLANKLSEPERADRYPRTIAYHLEQAARNALDLDPGDRTLAERAVKALAHAGDLARRQLESQAAVDLYDRALSLSGPESGWGEREAWILSLRGEAQYWLGEFPSAEDSLAHALELDPRSVLIRAHASRYLADISLTIRGERERAAELFDASLTASRELGNPAVLARTLLMAGWVPYWGNDLDRARAMFEEALEVARVNPRSDAWAEARALVGLSSITSPVGDEVGSLALAQEALEIGRTSNDAFTAAVAHENVANSLRRQWRLDDALEHAEEAIRAFRELGARWELASALGDRGVIRRLLGHPEEAVPDLREAYRICRELNERALISWTAAELARALIVQDEVSDARRLLEEPAARLAADEPGSAASMLAAESLLALAEGDRQTARAKALEALELERAQGWPNPVHTQIVWIGRLLGVEDAGGDEAVRASREALRRNHWIQALEEPDQLAEAVE
ncbi:MAG: adenylate/guanylate cyclase domain-containing protein [Actinomycetota bacterium]